VEASRNEIRKGHWLGRAHFDELATPIEKKSTAPWLKASKEGDAEVIRTIRMDANGKYGTWQKASPEEIEAGILANSFDEYQSKKVA
jgi:hypothetical protein